VGGYGAKWAGALVALVGRQATAATAATAADSQTEAMQLAVRALRLLGTLAARAAVFELSSRTLAAMLHCPTILLHSLDVHAPAAVRTRMSLCSRHV